MVQEDWYQAMAPDERKKAMGRARSVIQGGLRAQSISIISAAQFGWIQRQPAPVSDQALGDLPAGHPAQPPPPKRPGQGSGSARSGIDLLKAAGNQGLA